MARSNRKHANARRTPQRSEMDSRPQPDSSSLAAQRAQAPSEAQTDSRNMSATTSEKPAGPAIVVSPGNAASPAAEPRLTYAMRAKLGVMKKDSAPAPARPLSSTASVASAASLVTSPPPTTPPAPSLLAASPKSEVMSEEALVTPPAKPALAVLVSVEPSTVTADDTTATTPTQASALLSPVSPADSDVDGALVSSLSMPSLSAASSRTSLMSVDELLSPRDSYDSPPPAAVFRKFYRDRVEGDRPAASMTASETPESNMATITVSLPTPKRAQSQVASRPPTPPVEEMQFASLNDPPAMDYSVFDQFDGAVAIYCPYPDDHLRHDSFYYQPRLTFEVPTQLSRDPSPAQQQQYAPPEHEQQQHVYAPPHHNGVYGWEMAPHHIHQQQQQQWCYVPVASGPPTGDMGVPPPAPYPMQAPDQAQYHQAAQQPNGAAPPPPPAPFVPAPAGPMRQGSFQQQQQQQKQQGPQQQQQQQQPPPMRPPYGQQHSQGRPSYNRGNSGSSAGGHAYGGRQQGWGPGPNNRGRGGGGGGGGRQFGNGGGRGGGFVRDREGAGGWRDGPGPMNGNGNGNRRDDGERGNAYDTRAPRNSRDNARNDAAGPPPAPAPAPAATQTAPPRT